MFKGGRLLFDVHALMRLRAQERTCSAAGIANELSELSWILHGHADMAGSNPKIKAALAGPISLIPLAWIITFT